MAAKPSCSNSYMIYGQVNSKATIMFSGIVDDGVHHNIFWPDLPYVTDEHGSKPTLDNSLFHMLLGTVFTYCFGLVWFQIFTFR